MIPLDAQLQQKLAGLTFKPTNQETIDYIYQVVTIFFELDDTKPTGAKISAKLNPAGQKQLQIKRIKLLHYNNTPFKGFTELSKFLCEYMSGVPVGDKPSAITKLTNHIQQFPAQPSVRAPVNTTSESYHNLISLGFNEKQCETLLQDKYSASLKKLFFLHSSLVTCLTLNQVPADKHALLLQRLAAHLGGDLNLITFLKYATPAAQVPELKNSPLNRGYTAEQLANVASHDGGSRNLEALVNYLNSNTTNSALSNKQLVVIVAHNGGSYNLKALLKHFDKLIISLTLEQIVRLVGHQKGVLNIKLYLDRQQKTSNSGNTPTDTKNSLTFDKIIDGILQYDLDLYLRNLNPIIDQSPPEPTRSFTQKQTNLTGSKRSLGPYSQLSSKRTPNFFASPSPDRPEEERNPSSGFFKVECSS